MIETARLTLRRPVPADWEAYRDFMMSERSHLFGSHKHLGKAFRSFAAGLGHWEMAGFGMFAVEEKATGATVAQVGPWAPPDWPEREVGWMILSDAAQGKGIAFEAAQAVLDHIWRGLGWDTVVSYIDATNDRSIRLAERLGARLDATAEGPEALGKTILVYRHPRPEVAA
ncbi:MAG TPA: GNAT family N-acetyltransferase [Rubellimicrobium sp.]|jgi:RimJ/RimL family protein N-acetyltransferase|nr:GNAT family N-acetyltransferase [Rubellimicrobium sp.]